VAIKLVPDVGAPLAVAAVDIVMDTTAPQFSEWARYGMAGLGYVAGWMGWGGDGLKNVGIAALPMAVKSIYNRVRGVQGMARSVRRPVSVRQPIQRSYQPEFNKTTAW